MKMEEHKKELLDRLDKIEHRISWILKLFLLGLFITSIIRTQYFLAFSSFLVLFLTFLPAIIEKNYKINLPTEFDFTITVLLWLSFVLGEVNKFYEAFHWWDIFLHWASSAILGIIGFTIVYTLFYTQKIKAYPYFAAIFTVAFAISLGTLWEIFEFSIDQAFGLNMQKSGLVDTMWDLIVNSIGAVVIGVAGYFYIKNPRKGFIDRIIRKMIYFNEQWK